MKPLEPITSIPVDFGKPTTFTSPCIEDVVDDIQKEYRAMGNGDVRQNNNSYARQVFMGSLSPEEMEEYNALGEAVKNAYAKYNVVTDKPDSETGKAYIAAITAWDNFRTTHGKHLCFQCLHYKQDYETNTAAICTYENRNLGVRPYCLACAHFADDISEQAKKNEELMNRMIFSKNPVFGKKHLKALFKKCAEQFASIINRAKDGDGGAFLLFQQSQNYYRNLYAEFPEVFAKTHLPTIDAFIEAYTADKDNIEKDNARTYTQSP